MKSFKLFLEELTKPEEKLIKKLEGFGWEVEIKLNKATKNHTVIITKDGVRGEYSSKKDTEDALKKTIASIDKGNDKKVKEK